MATVTVYADANYSGRMQALAPGKYNVGDLLAVGNDTISSILIPQGMTVIAYADENFSGATKILDSSSAFLSDFNDIISSLIILDSNQAVVFADASYKGRNQVLTFGNYNVNDLSVVGNDTISSVFMPANTSMVLYEHSNFSGLAKTINSSTEFLSDFNDIVSSIIFSSKSTNTGPKLEVIAGNNQTQPRVPGNTGLAIARFAPISVVLKDQAGNPLSGQQVTFSTPASAMAVQMEPSGASPCIVITDAQGIATLNKMGGYSINAYYADGPFTVTAKYGAASATITGTVGGQYQPTQTLSIVSGNNQSVARSGMTVPGGIANFGPLQVKLTNNNGTPAAGVTVRFRKASGPNAMAVQLEPGGGDNSAVVTDTQGVATLNRMGGNSISCYYAGGDFTIAAQADGVTAVVFNLKVVS